MVKPKVLILFAAGTNCEMETQTAFEIVGTKTRLIHINELKKNANLIHKFHIFVIPGGFSYGDYISAGKVLANEIKNSIMEELFNFSRSKKIILGICNGFQVLLKLGLLPYELKHVATLTFNDSGKFECRWVYLKTFKSYITKGMPEVIELPVAHAEGKFVVKSKKILDTLKKNNQIIFKYVDETGIIKGYPYNPDGSQDAVAAIRNINGNIIGVMPHPERYIFKYQHPLWRSKNINNPYGLVFFNNLVDYVKNNLL